MSEHAGPASSGLSRRQREGRRAAEYLFRWAATLRKLAPKPGQEEFSAEKTTREVTDEFRARVSAEDQPAAAAAVEAFLQP